MFEDVYWVFGFGNVGILVILFRVGDKRKVSGLYNGFMRGVCGRGMFVEYLV